MGARSLRALAAPVPARVIAGPSGVPHAVVAQGRRRMVTAILEDWLVQDRWWTDDPVDRHYFELVVEPGRRAVVFRDERRDAWLTHDPGLALPAAPRAGTGSRARPTGAMRPSPHAGDAPHDGEKHAARAADPTRGSAMGTAPAVGDPGRGRPPRGGSAS